MGGNPDGDVVLSRNLRVQCPYGCAPLGCEFMLVISKCPGRLTRQKAGDNGGEHIE